MFYDRTDNAIALLDGFVIKEFNRLKLFLDSSPDDLWKKVKQLYGSMTDKARSIFPTLATAVYRDHFGSSRFKSSTGKDIVEDVLTGYDPMSKYVFTNEMERRVGRLYEALMGSPTREAEVDAAKRSMALAYHIYAVRVTDEAAVRAMKASGVKKVRWAAEDDSHTCKICNKRDDKVYDIKSVPPKPHINCRCWLVRVP